ncbi:hypothetical protein [Amycolatopsis sp. NPDC058986]|uniref:hypothetical protein n=1 Tax=unclassified Amycolatopsis TaxID=2618356 RepID=UPI00366DCD00
MSRPTAERFQELVAAIAGDGYAEILLNAAGPTQSYWIEVLHKEPRIWLLTLLELPLEQGERLLRNVSIERTQYGFDVVYFETGEPVVLAGDFRGLEAAIGAALDYVAAPAWHADAQHAHDACAV